MEKYEVTVDNKGTVRFCKPGTTERHRLDGPAAELTDGTKFWYVDGKQHRLDGPAIEYANGTKYWFANGKQHRLDGPAVELADGTKYWYADGNHHRLDGPAIEHANGSKYWYIDGVKLTEKQFKKKTAPVAKELTVADIEKLLGHKVKVIS